MEQAEQISLNDFDAKKVAVISGIGARDWFYEQDYKLDGPYVSKILS
jgi:elongator complex protein 3